MAGEVTAGASAESRVYAATTRSIIVAGLVVGAVLGFGGNFVEPGDAQNLLYGVSAMGLIVAAVLLALGRAFVGDGHAAAGFALLALGEARLLTPTDSPGAQAAFAAATSLYAAGVLMVALSTWAPRWVRLAGAIAALPFAAHFLAYLGGRDIDSTGPLAGIGYALLTVTIVGWVRTVLRPPGAAVQP